MKKQKVEKKHLTDYKKSSDTESNVEYLKSVDKKQIVDKGQDSTKKLTVDSRGRTWRTDKDKIEELADLMNNQSIHPLQTSDELFHIFDAVLDTEQIKFMLKMGGGKHTLESLIERIDLPETKIRSIIDDLVYKGPIAIIKDEKGNDVYSVMSIFPGWFELYLMRGEKTEESKLFAERVEELFEAAYRFGNEDVINQLMRDVGPHIKVLSTKQPKKKTVQVRQEVEPYENVVFSTKSIISIFEELADDETITIGNCFCRFEKHLIGDPCRTGLPLETCISIGPAAEHLLKQGIAKKITKEEAITKIKGFQEKGAIHQTTRTIPIKDFQAKYQFDIFCNCCWDCCGIVGNYNRGYLPYILKSYHRAIIPDAEVCTGCGACLEYCPVRAINIGSSGKAEIDDNLCIGCGHCFNNCSFDAIKLIEDEREVFLPMLDKSKARIKPKDYEESSEELTIDETVISDKSEVLEVLNGVREKMTSDENIKVFRKWNKTFLYHFTDLDEYWNFSVKDGQPGSLKQGKVDSPDISYELSGSVFIGLMTGEIDGFQAFRKKLVKVEAPVRDLIKLQKLIG